MSSQSQPLERYLEDLAEGVGALGPLESAEVVREIRGHIEEAAAEKGGAVEDALGSFGPASALAARILEERGLLAGPDALSAAPAWMRAAALLVDATVSAFVLLLLMAVATRPGADRAAAWATLVVWTAIAATLGLLAWWWAVYRRRPLVGTTGLDLLGLRRVRAGSTPMLVRAADIPDLRRPGRVRPAIGLLVAVLFVSAGVASLQDVAHERAVLAVESATDHSSVAVFLVSDLYSQVLNGDLVLPTDDDSFITSEVTPYVTHLVAEHAAGRLIAYTIGDVRITGYAGAEDGPVDVMVGVLELRDRDRGKSVGVTYTVRGTPGAASDDSRPMTYQIVRVEQD